MWAVHHESPILTLRIDHQRPSSRTVHNDSIINGKRIHRKSGDLPVTHFDRFSECWVQWEVLWAWNLDFLTQVDPLRDTILLRKMKWSWVLIINTWWYSHTIKSLYLSLPLIFQKFHCHIYKNASVIQSMLMVVLHWSFAIFGIT